MAESLSLDVLVVDDERYARQRLMELMEQREAVDALDCADSGTAAIEALEEGDYDLVFLDVQMPERTGVEVVDAIGPSAMPPTIFVTAYDQYALDAFDRAALDYLLKPFDNDRFEQAFQRALDRIQLRKTDELTGRLRRLLDASDDASGSDATTSRDDQSANSTESPYLERITVDLPGKVRVIPVEEIHHITAEDAYVKIHTADDSFLIRERMHVLEDRLDPADFVRIHRSTIVRIDLIETVLQRSGGNYAVLLRDRTKLKVSRSRHDDLLDRLEMGTSGG
jgi:two-component system LytT family response regulator